MKIRTGDTVVVISGKDKGRTGQVLRVLHEKNRLVVADINMRTRHVKKTPNRAGEIIKYEAALHASNVMLVDPKTKKRTRIGAKVDEKGRKMRFAKRSGEEIKKAAVAAKKVTSEKAADKAEAKVKSTKETAEVKDAKAAKAAKAPFWKKMGFGAEEASLADADVATGTHMQEDHSVPEQVERTSNRGSGRGS